MNPLWCLEISQSQKTSHHGLTIHYLTLAAIYIYRSHFLSEKSSQFAITNKLNSRGRCGERLGTSTSRRSDVCGGAKLI